MTADSNTTVLTIEDEAPVRMSISAYLEDHGYTVLEAENGRIGLEVFRHEAPDLILLDLRMPEVDGLEVLATIKAESPDTPVIVVSGAGVIRDAVEALRLGAWDYLLKPIADMDILLHAIQKALERSRLLLENRIHQEHLEQLVKERTAKLELEIAERRRVEEALKDQYEFLQTLMDATPISVFFKDREGIFLGCNKAYEQFLGLQKNEIIGKSARDVFVKDLADNCVEMDEALFMKPGSQFYEAQLDHADGTRRNVLFSKATYMDKNGEIRGLIGAMTDLTKRKLMEEELLKEKNFSDWVLNSLPGIFYLFDEDGNIIRWNDNFEELTGYGPAEIRNMKPTDFFDGQEKALIAEKIREVFTLGKAHVEAGFVTNSKRKYRYYFTGFRVVMKGRNYVLGVGVDISLQKQAEDELRESEKRYRAVVEDMPAMICRFTKDGIVSFVNEAYCKFFSRKPEEVIGQNFFQFIPKTEQDIVRAHFMSLNQDMPIMLYEHQGIFPDGSTHWMEWIDRALFNEKGQVAEYQMIGRDITDVKLTEAEKEQIQKQLQQAQKMEALGALAGGIAHDFNNILAIIVGCAELALMMSSGETKIEPYLNRLLDASNLAKELVQQILAFSQQREMARKPLNVNFVLKEALKMLRSSLPSTIEIRQDMESAPGMILADPTQIHQVLMNLCTNAAHAMMDKGGLLQVSLTNVNLDSEIAESHMDIRPGPYVRLAVSDTGHGMPPEIMERIFEPYFTTKRPGKGTGLGLAVVHGIVKNYNGDITVHSKLGEGTTFQVFLPRIDIPDNVKDKKELSDIPTGKERILIIDDEKELIHIERNILEHLGYEVIAKTSSVEALDLFRKKSDQFDLVITDMTMPYITGDALARSLLQIRPDIPIILCTGFNERITEESAKKIGVREYILKPIMLKELSLKIRKVLDSTLSIK